jgi:plasmid stabilization system protein ParE
MSYRVEPTARAEADLERLYDSLAEMDPDVAVRWYDAFLRATERLRQNPFTCGLAFENDEFDEELHHLLFGTRRGKTYRALFVVRDDVVFILCVRAPGQKPVRPEDLQV